MDAKDIYMYLIQRRRVGHTYTMLHGALNNQSLVVADNPQHAKDLRKEGLSNVVHLGQDSHVLMGMNLPISIDNFALQSLFLDLFIELKKARNEALEEAAKVADEIELTCRDPEDDFESGCHKTAVHISKAIRDLKEK